MFCAAFPKELGVDVRVVLDTLPNISVNDVAIKTSADSISYILGDGMVEIPYRMYFSDIDDTTHAALSATQKQILCCIYTRNCDGFVREKYLRKLLTMPIREWAFPFIVKLCDEYVVEIVEVIYNELKGRDNTDIQSFCLENKNYIRKSYSRMISYWNEYYRGDEPDLKRYVGRKLFRDCLGYNRSFER